MALYAVFFGRCLSHRPEVRLMTIFALHVHIKVQLVLAGLRNAGMTTQTHFVVWQNLALDMGFMALIAVELHGRILGEGNFRRLLDRRRIGGKEPHIHGIIRLKLLLDALIRAMTIETLETPGLEILRPVGMAVDAGQATHADTMYLPVLVALGAEFLGGKKMVQAALVGFYFAVALRAFYLLHKNMFGVEHRRVDALGRPLGVALFTSLLRHDDLTPMACGNARRTMQYEIDKEFVLLRDGQVMAVMAVQRLVLALRPTFIRRLHQMAAHTKLGIVLREVVKPI